jgi:hypothetical protein
MPEEIKHPDAMQYLPGSLGCFYFVSVQVVSISVKFPAVTFSSFNLRIIRKPTMTAKTPDTEEENGKKRKGGYMQINKSLNIGAFEDYLEAQLSHLPAIADVERISPRVIRVLGQNAGKVIVVLFLFFQSF